MTFLEERRNQSREGSGLLQIALSFLVFQHCNATNLDRLTAKSEVGNNSQLDYTWMSHLESLIAEYLEWEGYLIRRNLKVGRRAKGGWEMELDVVGYHPKLNKIVHYEPSIDALTWPVRERRYQKKLSLARKYMFSEIFPWLDTKTEIEQIAIFYNHPKGRDTIAGATLMSIDELVAEIRLKVIACGPMISNAISQQYPLLRTIQMSHVGYSRAIPS